MCKEDGRQLLHTDMLHGVLQRRACKDATSVLPLRKILSNKRSGKSGSLSSAEVTSSSDNFGKPETVQVSYQSAAFRTW